MKLHFFPAELTDEFSALFPSGQEKGVCEVSWLGEESPGFHSPI
jgi:hypothetical protein